MEKKLDLRIQKTYAALTDALLSILCHKSFEDITVNEICVKALVRRATFYKHFGDKYELLTFIIKQQLDIFKQNCAADQINRFSFEYYLYIFHQILDYIDDHTAIFQSVKNSKAFSVINAIATEELFLMMKDMFKEDALKGKDFILPYDIMARAYVGIVVSISGYWVEKSDNISKEELMEQFKILAKRLYS
ncbi:MAG: TetR/AcrR family transcriptional regulator [Acutalibacteraceae bacterium]